MDINRVAHAPAAEQVAFILMAALIGWFWAAGLFTAASIAGALLLARFGCSNVDRVGAAFARRDSSTASGDARVATGLGAILLIFPGFISALPGAGLAASGVPADRVKIRNISA